MNVFSHLKIALLGSMLASLSSFAGTTLEIDFSDGMGPLVPLEAKNWEVKGTGDEAILALIEEGEQRGGVRRPTEFVLTEGQVWANYEIRLRAQTKEPVAVTGRDVVVIFGYQDFDHFYYAHLCSDSNNTTHNIIMKVDGGTRTVIMNENLPETRLSDGWHDLRITHATTGEIRVYMDDMETPLMTAEDTSFPAGAVGFGCFDDRAEFDDFKVTGENPVASPGTTSLRPIGSDGLLLQFAGVAGWSSQLERSLDLAAWEDEGTPLVETTPETRVRPLRVDVEGALFFRVVAQPPVLP